MLSTAVTIELKNYLKNTKNKVGKIITQNNNHLLLRAPKHFKAGKQTIRKSIRKFTIQRICQTTNIDFLYGGQSSVKVYCNKLILQSMLPEEVISRISIKNVLTFSLNGWCFVY